MQRRKTVFRASVQLGTGFEKLGNDGKLGLVRCEVKRNVTVFCSRIHIRAGLQKSHRVRSARYRVKRGGAVSIPCINVCSCFEQFSDNRRIVPSDRSVQRGSTLFGSSIQIGSRSKKGSNYLEIVLQNRPMQNAPTFFISTIWAQHARIHTMSQNRARNISHKVNPSKRQIVLWIRKRLR